MALVCFWAFTAYVFTFVVMQRVIGRYYGVRRTVRHESLPGLGLWAVFMIAFPLVLLTMLHQRPHVVPIVIGGVLVVAGLMLSLWGQIALGKNWVGGVGLHKKHQLIATGPFKFVRHPMYAGFIVSAVGFALLSWNVLYAVAMVVWCSQYLVRIPMEEQLMLQRFRKPYSAYMTRTGALLPKLRK